MLDLERYHRRVKHYYKKDVLYISKDQTIDSSLKTMLENSCKTAVVVRNLGDEIQLRDVIGIISTDDIMREVSNNVDFDEPVDVIELPKCNVLDIQENIFNTQKFLTKDLKTQFIVKDDNIVVGTLDVLDILNKDSFYKCHLDGYLQIGLDKIHEAVCVINTDAEVIFWNKAAEKLYDTPVEEILGEDIREVIPNALIYRCLMERKEYQNIKHTPKEGAHVIINAIPIEVDGELLGAVSTDRDISEVENLLDELNDERKRVKELQTQMLEITQDRYHFDKIIGKSKVIENAILMAKKVSKTDASVLLTGESGTGKEVFARAIHNNSRRTGDFIPINCSAIPPNLFESELFGYEKGAFTGAGPNGKPGKFELANNGTLFLDEIGDLPFMMQAKLLRVLQDGVVTRIGGDEPIKTDARILAATNKDLEKMMQEDKFREDLYYRLNVVSIEIPPLRSRKEDIPDLIKEFIDEFALKNQMGKIGITNDAIKILTDYEWEGNIRQLRNIIERLVILSQDHMIHVSDIPNEIISSVNTSSILDMKNDEVFDLNLAIENFEKQIITKALVLEKGNKSQAAKRLNIKRSTLYYKLNLYDLEDFQPI